MLSDIDWQSAFASCTSIDDYWYAFRHECLNVISLTTPLTATCYRSPTIPRYLRSAVLKKKRLWRKYLSGPTPVCLINFKIQRNRVSHLFRQFRSLKEHRILRSYSSSQFWRYCSRRISYQDNSFSLPMTYHNNTITDINSLPAAFNSFFTSVIRSDTPTGLLPFVRINYTPLLSSLCLSTNDVFSSLMHLKSTFNSPDGIPSFFLKTFAPKLVYPLTTIFNISLASATLPKDWKHAIVTPLYKGKGQVNDITNYRPISCTSVTGKVLESLVKQQLLSHLMSNSLLSTAQFGFLPGRSTSTNLLFTDHLIHKELNSGNCVDTILFDISKAFDTVPHSSLLQTLTSSFGIVGKLHAWIKAFLTNRTQSVKISPNLFSPPSSVSSGVIQGSILGPILYTAYTNDIVKCFSYGSLFYTQTI